MWHWRRTIAQSGLIYFSYAEPRDGDKNGTRVARAKLVLSGDSGRLEDVKVVFRQQPAVASSHHFGSRLVFNADGTMFITTGDRGSTRDEAQNPGVHIGKIIRLKLDGAPADDNPKLPGWAPEVWSIGHRNAQGAALDPATGQLWTAEHGARGGDELNHPEKGKNYGWPVITYGRDYSMMPDRQKARRRKASSSPCITGIPRSRHRASRSIPAIVFPNGRAIFS